MAPVCAAVKRAGACARRARGSLLSLFWEQQGAAFYWTNHGDHTPQLLGSGGNTDWHFQAHGCTQADSSRTEKAPQSFSGGELQNLEVPKGVESWGGCHGCKCAQVDELFKKVAKLFEEITMQHSIQESERDLDVWYCTVTWADWQFCLRPLQGEACFQPWTGEWQSHARWGRLSLFLCWEQKSPCPCSVPEQ